MLINPNYTTINLSFLKNKGKESYDVIKRFFHLLKVENEDRVRTLNIERACLTPSRMYWTARDNQTGKTYIFQAPGFSIEVKGATFQGGLMIYRDKVGSYHIFLFDHVKHSVSPVLYVDESKLITTIDRIINGAPIYNRQNKFNS